MSVGSTAELRFCLRRPLCTSAAKAVFGFLYRGAFRISIDRYDTAWTGHLELEISIVWHCVESSKRSSSEQCMIAAAEGDDIEDEFFATEVVRRSEDNLERD